MIVNVHPHCAVGSSLSQYLKQLSHSSSSYSTVTKCMRVAQRDSANVYSTHYREYVMQ